MIPLKRFWLFFFAFILLFGGSARAATDNPVSVRVSASGGFDNNSGLNSERKGDYFSQETATVLYKRLLDKKNQVRLSYNALNVNYFEATDLNIFLNEVSSGWSYLLTQTTVWETDYTFQFLDFTRNEAVTSYQHEVRSGLRQRISDDWMVRAGYTVSWRQYTDKTLLEPSGQLSFDEERAEDRHSIDVQVNYKWKPDVLLNAGTVLYKSDSNDQFQDYYDYEGYRFFLGASWQIDPKWLCLGKFTYEIRDYDDRPLVDLPLETQSDDLYTGSLSLYYKVDTHLTIGSAYTYREKTSNEPSQQYSGSIGTLGVYYSF